MSCQCKEQIKLLFFKCPNATRRMAAPFHGFKVEGGGGVGGLGGVGGGVGGRKVALTQRLEESEGPSH